MASYPHVEPSSKEDLFEQNRKLLFGIAYRMLGTVADAEDILQEAWLRWQSADHESIRSPKAFLTTIVTRLAINQLDSARHRREEYIGPWLPEPLIGEPDADKNAELAESLSIAFLRMLERLSPVERAVFLLREVFEYDYADVSQMVDKSEANCRQILKRAREGLSAARGAKAPASVPSPQDQAKLAKQFTSAIHAGDLASLANLLSADITLYTDGGGRISAALNPIYGADKVARFLVGVNRKFPHGMQQAAMVNGSLGALIFDGDHLDSAMAFEFDGDRISGLYVVRNPEKLRHLKASGNEQA